MGGLLVFRAVLAALIESPLSFLLSLVLYYIAFEFLDNGFGKLTSLARAIGMALVS